MSVNQNRPSQLEERDQPYWGIFEAVSDGLIIHDSETQHIVEANSAAAAMHGYTVEEFIGLPLAAYIHPDSQEDFIKSTQAVRSGVVINTPAVHLRCDGSPFYVEVRRTAFIYQSHACQLSVVRDVSERVEAEQLLYQQEEVRLREQSILLDISHALASSLELKPDLILDQLHVIIKYTHAALFILEDSTLVAVALRGVQQLENATPFRIRLDGPKILARLFNKHRPIRIADVTGVNKEARFLRSLLKGDASCCWMG
jgi:PAS domain S-box-containing protein